MSQAEVILGRMTAPGVPERNVVLRDGALFAGADPISPQRLVSWDRCGHFVWASPNMHDVFYGQHPQLAENLEIARPEGSTPVAPAAPGRRSVVWLHTGLATSSVVLASLLGLLLGLRSLLGAMLSGGTTGVAAMTIAGGLVAAAAFLGGWLLTPQAFKRGAPRTVVVTPLAFAAIMIVSFVVSSPRSSLGATMLSFGVPVTVAAVAMYAGALAADPQAAAGRSIASRLATLGLTLVVAMSSCTLAAASMPANSLDRSNGVFATQDGNTDGSTVPSEDEYRSEAEGVLPGWKVEQYISEGPGAICLLGSSSAPTVHLVLTQSDTGETSLDAFRGQTVALAAFAQAFARKHPGTDWAVSWSGTPMKYGPQGGQGTVYTYVGVRFVSLASFNSSVSSGDALSGGDSEEWVLTGAGNSVSWMTSDDPRLGALLQQSYPSESLSGAQQTYPQDTQSGSYASPQSNPQGYSQNGAYQVAP
ncbi:MAG: hypothetical protein P4L93_05505 [Coriobacteriia bacterium]|nr:hypothetical protein [Coriobacteriia bacterium]